MATKKFQKNKEDFTCEQCGAEVTGNGYTNHCPKCLWSKHVDVFPGDRAATCQGLMEPIDAALESEGYVILQRCVTCGHERRNKASKDDDFDVILQLTN
ncbi:MAG: RNHCP domain-containing protein [Candidatus Paceibacterota bacterium]|jgi:hypothetical protein